MQSIRAKLNWALIILLIVISIIFSLPIGIQFFSGVVYSPEAYAQIFAALATLLVVFVTVGLRLIDDTLKRFESFSLPRLNLLITKLAPCTYKWNRTEVRLTELYDLSTKNDDFLNTAKSLKKYGNFFFTKLYPNNTLDDICNLSNDLDRYNVLVLKVKSYWEGNEFHFPSFLQEVINENTPMPQGIEAVEKGKNKIKQNDPQLVEQVKKSGETILLNAEKAYIGLQSFLDAN